MRALWDHQQLAKDQALKFPKRLLAWDPRLGKTQGAIECIKTWGEKRGIIVAPLLVCPMWSKLLEAEGYAVQDAYKGSCEAVGRTLRAKGDRVVVVNYDRLYTLVDRLIAFKARFIIGDESHWIKSPSAKRARAFRRLAWQIPFARLLSGTPAPNHYGDLWGQMTCIDPDTWGKSYGKYANEYLIRHPMFPSQITGYRNLDKLERLLALQTHTVRREDVFGPDQYQFIERRLSFSSIKISLLYKRLAKEWVLDTPFVTAEHILKRLVRLQQFTSGYLPIDGGGLQEIHTLKVDAVLADLDEIFASGQKVILFHLFKWEGEKYEKEIKVRFPGILVGRVRGGMDPNERTSVINAVSSHDESSITICQTRAGGIGVDFSNADHVFFVSNNYSWTDRKQAFDRIYKPGQRRIITDYIIEGTIDQAIAKAVASKETVYNVVRSGNLQSLVFGE